MTEYCTPTSIAQALDILATHHGQARVLAGGTDLFADIQRGRARPYCLVDVTRVPGMDAIMIHSDRIEVGAGVTFAVLRRHPHIGSHVHALAGAAASVGTSEIQNVATWAGNLVQAMPAADGAIVALALDAEALVEDRSGARWLPVSSLFAGPGRSTLDPTSQILTRLRFPIPAREWGTGWRRIGRRDSLVLPVLNCAVKLEFDAQCIARASIALGPVAPVPFRAARAEAFLAGKEPDHAVFAEAARLVREEASPRSNPLRASREYRLAVIPALVEDTLVLATGNSSANPRE